MCRWTVISEAVVFISLKAEGVFSSSHIVVYNALAFLSRPSFVIFIQLSFPQLTQFRPIHVLLIVKIVLVVVVCRRRGRTRSSNTVSPDSLDTPFLTLTMVKFLDNMEREKPIRFTTQQLKIATNNFRNLLGSGGFGPVYKGDFSNGTTVAVKVLNGTSDKRIEEQFMAEVSTIGRIHHFNLVRLYGFCFDKCLRALVYDYMENGSLDKYLFRENKILGFEKLYEIAVGTARGIAYLHEECRQRIIHYDIKPGNILLDAQFCPKVADFGLAKLYNRDNTHISMTGQRGTPGRRKNLDFNLPESQEWFPRWVWNKFEKGESKDLMTVCAIEENKEKAEKMVKVAVWRVQYIPESRPLMGVVVKMLEGEVEIPAPLNPFHYLSAGSSPAIVALMAWNGSGFGSGSSQMVTGSSLVT
ncbi:hypothetical protein F0562_030656 [Nyssa sinensis]|uniref:Protein kinase domain-containing protein n=1 Tax=Nyssa sinensis TaxID=561372 RepID=A0A5J5AXI2_9ASTE|nr:hypothetical protein F0562_030656 [Nyssa sinensis]